MRRRLFMFAAIVSLVGFLATVTLWVRSRFVADDIYVQLFSSTGVDDLNGSVSLVSARGTLEFAHNVNRYPFKQVSWHSGFKQAMWTHGPQKLLLPLENEVPIEEFDSPAWTKWGFHYSNTTGSLGEDHMPPPSAMVVVCVPYGAVALVLAILPGWMGFVRWRQHRRRRLMPGACENCGYDLRAMPECCPECGMVFSKKN